MARHDMSDMLLLSNQQRAIISEARKWLGTPFRHQGRTRRTINDRGGVDCLGLIVGVAEVLQVRSRTESGNIASYDHLNYSKSPDVVKLRKELSKHCLPLSDVSELRVGDIAIFAIDNSPQHLAIMSAFTNYTHNVKERSEIIPTIIHAYAPSRKVVEHVLDDSWRERLRYGFRFVM